MWAFGSHVSVHLLWCWSSSILSYLCHCLFSGDPLSSRKFTWLIPIRKVVGLTRCPHKSLRVLWLFQTPLLHFLFLSLCLCVILASLNSAVGTPLLCPISSILLTSWQKLVSCLQKLLIFLPEYMTRLHFLVFPAVRLTCGICMDPNYLLHTSTFSPLSPHLALSLLLHWHDVVKWQL